MDAVKILCEIRNNIKKALDGAGPILIDPAVKAAIEAEMEKLDRATLYASLTIEAFNPVLNTDEEARRSGELNVLDLCYNAFMIGRQQENRETGARTAYFNDCHPLMEAGVDRIFKEVRKRVEYAAEDRRRFAARAIENESSGLNEAQAEAGAACLFGHLDQSYSGNLKVSWPQASAHTRRKYLAAFAAASRESNRVPAEQVAA